MKLDYFVACDYAITDSVGRTAAIGIFDSMRLASPIGENPYVLNRFYLAIKILGTLIEGAEGSHRTWRHRDSVKHVCLVDKGHGAIPGGYIREMIAAIDEVQQVSPKSSTDA